MSRSNNKQQIPNLTPFELKRMAIIKRYANVAFDLPDGAKEALSSKMGSIEVTAKDSFEFYLMNLNEAQPKCDYINFQKRFAEIFERRATPVLKKIIDNRKKKLNYYVSNDYFWQEFRELFYIKLERRCSLCSAIEKYIGESWNRKLKGVFGFNRAVARVGVAGMPSGRGLILKKKGTQVQPVKWT